MVGDGDDVGELAFVVQVDPDIGQLAPGHHEAARRMAAADRDLFRLHVFEGMDGGLGSGDEDGSVVGRGFTLGHADGQRFDLAVTCRFKIGEGSQPADIGRAIRQRVNGLFVALAIDDIDGDARAFRQVLCEAAQVQPLGVVAGGGYDQGQATGAAGLA